MGLFIQQNDERSQLQQRLAEELREKAKQRSKLGDEPTDPVHDSAYLEGTKQTTSLAWVWMLIFIAAVGVAIFIAVHANG